MFREIEKKKQILDGRRPYCGEITTLIENMGAVDMAYTNLRLDGSPLRREDVIRIMDGEVLREASLYDHLAVTNMPAIYRSLRSMQEMDFDVNLKTLPRLYEIITGGNMEYRRSNPVVHQFGYNPPHCNEAPEALETLMLWFDGAVTEKARILETADLQAEPTNILLRAAYFHCRFVEIYPYEERNEEVARMLMMYYLMTADYPVFVLNCSEQEYNDSIIAYIKNKNIRPFYNCLLRSVYNKMDILVQLTDLERE